MVYYSFSVSYASLQPVYEPIHDIRGSTVDKTKMPELKHAQHIFTNHFSDTTQIFSVG